MGKTRGVTGATGGKGLIRSMSRRGSKSEKSPPAAQARITPGPTVCHMCGAVFSRKTWRKDRRVTPAFLDKATWRVCPACRQSRGNEGFGKVVLRGAYLWANEEAIRRRIENVSERASFTQPERRLASVGREGDTLEVLTTSQKLAHRIARELRKTFRGKTTYAWSDRDGALFATWEREDVPAPRAARRSR